MARPKSTFQSDADDRFGNRVQRPRVVRPVGHDRFLRVRKPAKAQGPDTSSLAGGARSVVQPQGTPGGQRSGMPAVASPVAVARALATRARASGPPHPNLAGSGLAEGRVATPSAMQPGAKFGPPPAPPKPPGSTNVPIAQNPLKSSQLEGPGYAVTQAGIQRTTTPKLVDVLTGLRRRRLQ